jgi:hypothetical protein
MYLRDMRVNGNVYKGNVSSVLKQLTNVVFILIIFSRALKRSLTSRNKQIQSFKIICFSLKMWKFRGNKNSTKIEKNLTKNCFEWGELWTKVLWCEWGWRLWRMSISVRVWRSFERSFCLDCGKLLKAKELIGGIRFVDLLLESDL